jgi:hypothetical protein
VRVTTSPPSPAGGLLAPVAVVAVVVATEAEAQMLAPRVDSEGPPHRVAP